MIYYTFFGNPFFRNGDGDVNGATVGSLALFGYTFWGFMYVNEWTFLRCEVIGGVHTRGFVGFFRMCSPGL